MNLINTTGWSCRGGLLLPPGLNERPNASEAGAEPQTDGYTDAVRALEARAAEACRIRALPTEKVLDRDQALAEERALAALERGAHEARLRDSGERERAELQAKADSAAAKRALDANTNVRALYLAGRRRSRAAMMWVVLVLAMGYTCVNVQKFAAGTAAAWSPTWVVAWFVDPLLSGLVVALLLTRGDLVAFTKYAGESRWDRWVVPLVEIGALVAVLLMNVSPEIQEHAAWESVALHIVVPLAAVAAALALPVVQRRYADAIRSLYSSADTTLPTAGPTRAEYGANTLAEQSSMASPTASLLARAQHLIDIGQLDPQPSATRLREALRIGTDAAREVRDELRVRNGYPIVRPDMG